MVVLPTEFASPTPSLIQEGAGLADTVDLDPSVSLTSLAPASGSVPEPVPDPTVSKNKARRLRRKKGLRLNAFTVDKAMTTLLTFVCNVNGHLARILIDGGAQGN
ncbi:hypothetical protein BG011_002585, partial [Mortierella polycephala]